MLCHSHWFSACLRHTYARTHALTLTHTFASSHTELPQLADGIRADTGRPARLRAMAPGSRAVSVSHNMEDRGGDRSESHCYTTSPGCAAWQSLPQPWHKPWPKMMAQCPCRRPLPQPFTSPKTPPEPAPFMAQDPLLNTFEIQTLPLEPNNMVRMSPTTLSANLCRFYGVYEINETRCKWNTAGCRFSHPGLQICRWPSFSSSRHSTSM